MGSSPTSVTLNPMKIQIVTPASRSSRKGNWTTATRWAIVCRQLGHRVDVVQTFRKGAWDLLIALHARKSAKAIQLADANKIRSILILTGTDIYNRFARGSTVWNSMQAADRLVVLQKEALAKIPTALHSKTNVIYQSAVAPKAKTARLKTVFEFCCVGHLRPVKDPFRAVFATRSLPFESRIRVNHFGAALSTSMQRAAEKYSSEYPRYRWFGNYPRRKALARIDRSQALIVSSRLEGGSGVITEAMAMGTPVLASRVSGNIGLLGRDYSGFFDYRNTEQLADLMRRCEIDTVFHAKLRRQIKNRRHIVDPSNEKKSIERLLRWCQVVP